MPSGKTAADPFFSNIRQNMDLIDGVGQMPLKRPQSMTKEDEKDLPKWIREAISQDDGGKVVARPRNGVRATSSRDGAQPEDTARSMR